MCKFYGFYDFGRFYSLAPGEFNQTVDSFGIGAHSNLTSWLFVDLAGVRRLVTQPNGANVNRLPDYALFSRVTVRDGIQRPRQSRGVITPVRSNRRVPARPQTSRDGLAFWDARSNAMIPMKRCLQPPQPFNNVVKNLVSIRAAGFARGGQDKALGNASGDFVKGCDSRQVTHRGRVKPDEHRVPNGRYVDEP